MSTRKFYKQVYTITVLAEDVDDLPAESAEDIFNAIYDGPCSGVTRAGALTVMTGADMAKELIAQGSDPEFFRIDEHGEDVY